MSWFQPDPDKVTTPTVDVTIPTIGTIPLNATIKADLNVVTIGIDAMLRLQFLKSTRHTRGAPTTLHVRPGLPFFATTLDAQARGCPAFGRVSDSDSDLAIEVTARAGA